jgi:hypothetical protein
MMIILHLRFPSSLLSGVYPVHLLAIRSVYSQSPDAQVANSGGVRLADNRKITSYSQWLYIGRNTQNFYRELKFGGVLGCNPCFLKVF